jgi:ribosomal protein S18 acetylase RimI-like enzyme
MLVREAGPEDLVWIHDLLDERWGGQEQVVDGESYRPAELAGFIAMIDDQRVGYAALRVVGDVAEIGVIDTIRPREGVGTALVDALEEAARSRGLARCRAVTTNENRVAQAFYESLGFGLVGVRGDAVTRSRRIKPAIPLEGDDGTPITDELVYERSLRRSPRG